MLENFPTKKTKKVEHITASRYISLYFPILYPRQIPVFRDLPISITKKTPSITKKTPSITKKNIYFCSI